MNFKEMALNRQSCRKYSDKDVEIEKLYRICEVACLAPSACNSQPYKLHIVTKNYPKLEQLRKCLQHMGMNRFLNEVNNYIVIEQVDGNATVKIGEKMFKNDLNSIDIGLMISHITFQALDEGLSTCIIGAFRKEKILQAMDFSASQTIRAVIAIGYASEKEVIRNKVRKDNKKVIEIH